ncbi:basic proline-rich protein-like [Lutra lutra]|uniref:basic proline-rich protein-like n=1 Tax=Lutra lutra TaxID=9657 RepID=UPI001FD256D2|nr:basic proline-rich protein-like [Lutra lutra]
MPAAQPPPAPPPPPRRGPHTAGPDPGCEEGRRPAPPPPSPTRGLPAGAAAAAGQGWRRPGRAARPSGRGSPQPAAAGPPPELPARPLTCSPPPSGPSARRAAAAARPGPLSPPPLEAAGGTIRCDSARPPRLPPPASRPGFRLSRPRGPGAPRSPRAHLPDARPALAPPGGPPAPRSQRGRRSEGLWQGKLRHGSQDPAPAARWSLGPACRLGSVRVPGRTRPSSLEKRRNSSERRPAGFLSVVRASPSPARGSFPHSRQSWRPLLSVPFFPEESLSRDSSDEQQNARTGQG